MCTECEGEDVVRMGEGRRVRIGVRNVKGRSVARAGEGEEG